MDFPSNPQELRPLHVHVVLHFFVTPCFQWLTGFYVFHTHIVIMAATLGCVFLFHRIEGSWIDYVRRHTVAGTPILRNLVVSPKNTLTYYGNEGLCDEFE